MSKHNYKDLPVRDKAYFIITGINGSWLYNALYPHIEDIDFCKTIVEFFEHENDIVDWPEIQQHIDESYDYILQYRLERTLTTLNR